MNIFVIVFLFLMEILAARNAYIAWLRPREYFIMVNKHRERVYKVLPILRKLWPLNLIIDRPPIDLWWARIVSLFILLIGTPVSLIAFLIWVEHIP
jgi:hypothetical protein